MQISITSRARLGDRLVVASVSGGKDSTALALTLRQLEIPHVRVFADTGFEAPETYEYLDLLRDRLGPIEVVRNDSLWQGAQPGEEGMLTLIRRKKMFPSRLMRFCTQQLKIFPIRDHIRVLQDRGDEVVSAVGVRADESAARAAMAEWEFWDEMDAEIWRPLIRWSEQDVIDVHRRHGMPPNPLYLQGARRVGCSPCIHARKHDMRTIPAEQLVKIRQVEGELTADAVARGVARPTRAFFQLRGPDGLAFTPIDEVVRRAHLHRGLPIEAPQEPPGCARWGLCGSESEPEGSASIEPPAPSPRWIGHDHLEALGVSAERIREWLASGALTSPRGDGFYLRSPEFDLALEPLVTRRVVGRGHLLALGVTATTIASWLRRGTLRRTGARGFYDITRVAFEDLRPAPTLAPSVEVPPCVGASESEPGPSVERLHVRNSWGWRSSADRSRARCRPPARPRSRGSAPRVSATAARCCWQRAGAAPMPSGIAASSPTPSPRSRARRCGPRDGRRWRRCAGGRGVAVQGHVRRTRPGTSAGGRRQSPVMPQASNVSVARSPYDDR